MITRMDRASVKLLREDLEAAIAKVCDKHGLVRTTLGNISFNTLENTMTTPKLTFAPLRADQKNPAAVNPASYVGRHFKMGQRVFEILSQDGNTFIGRTQRGARYRLRLEQVVNMIEVK